MSVDINDIKAGRISEVEKLYLVVIEGSEIYQFQGFSDYCYIYNGRIIISTDKRHYCEIDYTIFKTVESDYEKIRKELRKCNKKYMGVDDLTMAFNQNVTQERLKEYLTNFIRIQ